MLMFFQTNRLISNFILSNFNENHAMVQIIKSKKSHKDVRQEFAEFPDDDSEPRWIILLDLYDGTSHLIVALFFYCLGNFLQHPELPGPKRLFYPESGKFHRNITEFLLSNFEFDFNEPRCVGSLFRGLYVAEAKCDCHGPLFHYRPRKCIDVVTNFVHIFQTRFLETCLGGRIF